MASASGSEGIIRINIDETSLPLYVPPPRGNIVRTRRLAKERKVTRAQKRLCLSFVAAICDDAKLQSALPQYLLANERTIRKQDAQRLQKCMPDNITLVRKKSAWTDAAFCMRIVSDLRRKLAERGCNRTAILFWDCARPHIAPAVITKARSLDIKPVMIPPRSTGILQPLDTHVFCRFKKELQDIIHSVDMKRGSRNSLEVSCFLRCVAQAIESTITNGAWQHSFIANGLLGSQEEISARIIAALGHDQDWRPGCEQPSLEMISHCFPKNYVVNGRIAYGFASEAIAARPRKSKLALRQPDPNIGRTRSETMRMRLSVTK